MKNKNVISSLPSKWFSLLTSESIAQRPVQTVVKVVIDGYLVNSFGELEDGKTWEFNSVEEAIKSKDIKLSGSPDCTMNTTYKIFVNDILVESGKYEDLKNSVTKDYIAFAKELGNGVPVKK